MPTVTEKPVVILGAGSTKACGGPLTDEILPAALNGKMAHDDQKTLVEDREELLSLSSEFLADCFNVPINVTEVKKEPPSARTPIDSHPTGQRFRSLFGPGLDWHTTGFQGWLDEQKSANGFPFS